jgi:GR25 family glycosyltransferase involved in LPS biosynthesis
MLFDKIIYINLDRRPDRKTNVEEIIKQHNLEALTERFPAVDGKKLNFESIDKNIISDKAITDAFDNKQLYTTMTIGGIGCALSHYNIYKKIIKEKINRCLILEDDITLKNNFTELCKHLETRLESVDYDLFFLGYHNTSIKYTYRSDYDFIKFNRVYGLFGYIVTLEGAKKLLNIFPLNMQIDSEISNNSNSIKILGLQPIDRLIYSDESSVYTKFGTDIQTFDVELIKQPTIGKLIDKNIKIIILIQFIVICILIYVPYLFKLKGHLKFK